ncbi:MAG: hypothetical protein ABF289_04225 [Clostridiales bacterium]
MDKNNKITEKGNFWFIEKIYPEIYAMLFEIEKKSKIDYAINGNRVRKVLESIVEKFERINFVHYNNKKNNPTLLERINYLKDYVRKKLPYLIEVKYKNIRKNKKDIKDYYCFIIKFGNACSHIEPSKEVEINYENLIKALEGIHLMFKRILKMENRLPKDVSKYNVDLSPIEEYQIYKSYKPYDSDRSKCKREFLGYTLDRKCNINEFAIIRLYKKKDVNEEFLERNFEAFNEAKKNSVSIPQGMPMLKRISNSSSDFYIIIYIFNKEPRKLDSNILEKMSIKEKLKICLDITKNLEHLHSLENPIYHRILSYDSIFLCKIKEDWFAFVVKLDFAKIDYGKIAYTIFTQVEEARKNANELKQKRYMAPDWETIDKDFKFWDRVDIFSLGILFLDILTDKIGYSGNETDDLLDIDFDEEFIDFVDEMISDRPEDRWDIKDVRSMLEGEYNKWS